MFLFHAGRLTECIPHWRVVANGSDPQRSAQAYEVLFDVAGKVGRADVSKDLLENVYRTRPRAVLKITDGQNTDP